MKPFDYFKATDGEPVITRDGRKVVEIKVFEADIPYCIVAYIEGEDVLRTYDISGKFTEKESSLDLFMAPKERKEWIVRRTRPNSSEMIVKGPWAFRAYAALYASSFPDSTIHEITITE